MIKADQYFKDNLANILNNGTEDLNPRPKYKDGKEAHSLFITQVFEKYDISNGEYPITTLRNTAIKTGIKEIMWIYLHQSNSLKDAKDLGINWWGNWDIGNGTIGKRYGYTVKKYNLFNKLIVNLMKEPFSRRHIINLWQESDFSEDDKGLKPCAYETLWSVRQIKDKLYLDMTLNQRSSDYITAGYINKTQYVALMMIVCLHLNKIVGKELYTCGFFSHFVQNLHIYDRHIEAAVEIMHRESGNQPTMSLDKNFNFSFTGLEQGKKLDSELEIAI